MRQQFGGCGPLRRITNEHTIEEALQTRRHLVHVLQVGRFGVANASHRLQRWLVEERRLTVDHFDDHDAQRPDVHLGTVRQTRDDFGRHPVRGTDQRFTFGQLLRHLRAEPKVGEFDPAVGGEQNRVGLDVTVDDTLQQSFTTH